MSLYTKYRPQSFSHLVGQDMVRETLLSEIRNNSLTHAYLFCGPRGTGKTSSARLVAKALNCTNPAATGEPCDTCSLCISIRDGSLIDVLEIDAASNRGIDEIRDLKEKINYAPSLAPNKVYIIDEVHMLTKEAFNALLKTLEEPPAQVYFVLCTTEVHKIPETIISRCQRFDFKRIDSKTIITRLSYIAQSEGIEAEDTALELIARHVEGGMRDAIGLLEQLTLDKKLTLDHVLTHLGVAGHTTVKKLVDVLIDKNAVLALKIIDEVHTEGYDLATFVRELLEYLRENLISSIQKNDGAARQWLTMIEHLEKARDTFKATIIPQLPLEIAAINICMPVAPMVPAPQMAAPQNRSPSSAPPPPVAPKFSAPIATPEATNAESLTRAAITSEMVKLEGTITEHWPRVMEHVNPPSLRRSLTQCSLVESGDSLRLVFRAKFHMEKVDTPLVRGSIERIIKELFGRPIRVQCELVIGASIPNAPTSRAQAPLEPETPAKSEQKTTPGAATLADKAMEMFNEW